MADPPLDAIDYDRLAAEFNEGLLTKLRGHAASEEFLELWVPDEDPARGILHMAEAAEEAGRERIAIRVAAATLSGKALGQCLEMLAGLGTVETIAEAAAMVIVVSEMRAPAAGASPRRAAPRRGGRRSEAGQTGGGRVARVADNRAIGDMEPAVRDRLTGLFQRLVHEGDCVADAARVTLRVECDGVALQAAINPADHVVTEARHRGAQGEAMRAVAEGLCAVLPGMTVQEASDHAAINLLHGVADAAIGRSALGIALPENADLEFRLAQRLCRALREAYRGDLAEGESWAENDFQAPPARRWLDLALAAREHQLRRAVAEFLADQGQPADGFTLVGLEDDLLGRPVRVAIDTEGIDDPAVKPRLLRSLERWLKNRLDAALQVHGTEWKDANRIRRL